MQRRRTMFVTRKLCIHMPQHARHVDDDVMRTHAGCSIQIAVTIQHTESCAFDDCNQHKTFSGPGAVEKFDTITIIGLETAGKWPLAFLAA